MKRRRKINETPLTTNERKTEKERQQKIRDYSSYFIQAPN